MREVTLEAPDISCDHCIGSIEKAVTKLPGVRFISGSPEKKAVTIQFDPDASTVEEIAAVMEEEGYPVKG